MRLNRLKRNKLNVRTAVPLKPAAAAWAKCGFHTDVYPEIRSVPGDVNFTGSLFISVITK
jgi:hypothetical protein